MPTKKKAPAAKPKAKPKAPAKKAAPTKKAPAAKKAPAPTRQKKVSEIMVLDLDPEDLDVVFSGLGTKVHFPEDIFGPTIRNAKLHPIMEHIRKNKKTTFTTKAASELRVRSYRRVFGIPDNLKVS